MYSTNNNLILQYKCFCLFLISTIKRIYRVGLAQLVACPPLAR